MIKTMRKCVICGKEFEPYGRQLSCSDQCRKQRVERIKKDNSTKYYKVYKEKVKPKKSLAETLADLDVYNKEHGTLLSYGEYVRRFAV